MNAFIGKDGLIEGVDEEQRANRKDVDAETLQTDINEF
jgi:hypothetical protein